MKTPSQDTQESGKHTPGPWEIKNNGDRFDIIAPICSRIVRQWEDAKHPRPKGWEDWAGFTQETVIAGIIQYRNGGGKDFGPDKLIGRDEMEANAELIAQAPALLKQRDELLEALELAFECLDPHWMNSQDYEKVKSILNSNRKLTTN